MAMQEYRDRDNGDVSQGQGRNDATPPRKIQYAG